MTAKSTISNKAKLAIIVSQFNEEVTSGLLHGAKLELTERGAASDAIEIYSAPGAFEIPLIAKKLAETGRYHGVICLGCVIKGDTAHFEYISEATSAGLMTATLETGIPITFGILTTYTDEQAEIRSRDDDHNKGREAAGACVESLATLDKISALRAN